MSEKLPLVCFIIMPFEEMRYTNRDGGTKLLDKDKLDYLYKRFFLKAVESFETEENTFTAERFTSSGGNFIKGIVNKLHQADIVIADITGLNPNVMYELGIRHTLKNNTIMLAQDATQIPSDLKQYIAILYDYPWGAHEYDAKYSMFEKDLHKALSDRLEKWEKSDNPVRDFLSVREVFKNEIRIEQLKTNLLILREMVKHFYLVLTSYKFALEEWKKGNKDALPPYIDTDWEPFIFTLLGNLHDADKGQKLLLVLRRFKLIKNNMTSARFILETGTVEDIRKYTQFININGEEFNLLDIDHRELGFVLGMQQILEEWNKELTELI